MSLPDYLLSAHALVKALKAARDPPQDGGPTKLSIATTAIHEENTYLPNKEQIVLDFILDTWSRSKPGPLHPLLDPRYHELFALVYDGAFVDVAPLYVAYFTSARTTSVTSKSYLLATRSFRTLGANQTPKVESWAEVWTAFITCCSVGNDNPTDMWGLVSQEWLPEASAESSKKLSALILPTLPAWSGARRKLAFDDSLVFSFLFSWPSLQATDSYQAVVDNLGMLCTHTALMIVSLFRAYVQAITTHRYRIFIQPTSSKVSSEVYLAERVRKAVHVALSRTLGFLSDDQAATWNARAAVWREVNEWGGYLETEQVWPALVRQEKVKAETVLESLEACRSAALIVLEQLELLDHHAADLQTNAVSWCLAAPSQLFDEAERVLVALSRFHRLTRSFPRYCLLLRQSSQQLLESCQTSMAIRSVYDLVANGIISRPALREALSSKGVSARDVLDAIVTRHESPKKRRRLDKPSVLEAAQSGIDSRITRAVLSGWQGDWSDIERTVDLTPLESVTSWSGNVMLAARLRVLNTLKWAQDAPLMEFDAELLADDAVLLETRLELALYTTGSGTNYNLLVQILAEPGLTADSMWRMIIDLRLFGVLSLRLSTEHYLALLRGNSNVIRVITPDLVDSATFLEAVDIQLEDFDASDPLSLILIPFASKSTIESAVRRVLLGDTSLPEDVQWITQALAAGYCRQLLSGFTLASIVRKAASDNRAALLRCIYKYALLGSAETAILLDELATNRGGPLALFFDSIVADDAKQMRISEDIRVRLRDLSREILCTASSSELGLWLASLRLQSWLGHALEQRTSIKLHHTDMRSWSLTDLTMAVEIFRLESDMEGVVKCLGSAFVLESGLGGLLENAAQDEVAFLLPLVLGGIEAQASTAFSLAVIGKVLNSAREDVINVVRQSALVPVVVAHAHQWSIQCVADVLESLCGFVTRHPYAVKAPDVVLLLNLALEGIARRNQQSCSLAISLVMIFVRHRRDVLAQHVPVLVDLCRILLPQFANRQQEAVLGVADAMLFSRFLVKLVDGQVADIFHTALVKHLPAVLVAYARVVADPRGNVRPDVRKEMVPGLWALCDVLTIGGRVRSRGREGEALGEAFGLGDGPGAEAERDVWADLWGMWASKRYTGQG